MKSLRKNKIIYVYVIAVVILFLAVILGVLLGSTRIDLWDTLTEIINGKTDSADARILLYVRLPRVLGSLACGMALAVSGAVIQGVLANRLASPSIISSTTPTTVRLTTSRLLKPELKKLT